MGSYVEEVTYSVFEAGTNMFSSIPDTIITNQGLTSFPAKFSHLRLGTFSILKEIEHTRSLGLKYYCLGYYVQKCQKMSYKNNFRPREHYNWLEDKWEVT